MKLSECPVGSIVTFKYFGGSTPGRVRTAKILENHTNSVLAEDQDAMPDHNIRRFQNNLAESVQLMTQTLKTKKQLPFYEVQEFVASKLTAEQVAEHYKELTGATNVSFDSATGDFLVEEPSKEKLEVSSAADNGIYFYITNNNGIVLQCSIMKDGRLYIGIISMSISDFFQKIANHLLDKS